MKQTFNLKGIEIFSVGTWNGDKYSEKDLDAMIEAFNQVRFTPPLKLGHNSEQEKDGQPALGWVDNIYRQGKKLVADFKDLPLKVYEAIQAGTCELGSEIYWNYKNSGRTFSRALRAITLKGLDLPTDLESLESLYAYSNRDYKFLKIYERRFIMSEESLLIGQEKVEKMSNTPARNYVELNEYQKTAGNIVDERAKAIVKAENISYLEAVKQVLNADPNLKNAYLGIVKKKPSGKGAEEGPDESEIENDRTKKMSKPEAGIEVDKRTKVLMEKEGIKDYSEAMYRVLDKDSELKEAYI